MPTRKKIVRYPGKITLFLVIFALPFIAFAQHNGDNPAFQGLSNTNDIAVKALGMGGAYTSISGDLNSLFYNAAGLADIEDFQLSISAKSSKNLWRENQVWWALNNPLTASFILDGLWMPGPEYNGVWADSFKFEPDEFNILMGKDEFSEEAADWQEEASHLPFTSIAAALPIDISGKHFVVSASYNRLYDIHDYDRNDTYLDPHFGRRSDPRIQAASGDTLHMDWYKFSRERTGGVYSITSAIAYKLSKNINIGIGMNTFSGETDDNRLLDKVARIDMVGSSNQYRLWFDTEKNEIKGTSTFSATNFNFGANVKLNRLSFGLNIRTPYTIKREWSYNEGSGTDEVKLPLCYTFGIAVEAAERVLFSFDYERNPFSKAEFKFADVGVDTTHFDWADQTILRFGVEYRPADFLSLLVGYRNVPQTFIPTGAPYRDQGPSAESITCGVSLKILSGRLDIAYEHRRLKYYDTYEINQNYVLATQGNILVGYTFVF